MYKREMTLSDTVSMMVSADYKKRFRAEYHQLRIRMKNLSRMLDNWREGKLTFTPSCPYTLLNNQPHVMGTYKRLLEERAKLENIDLQ